MPTKPVSSSIGSVGPGFEDVHASFDRILSQRSDWGGAVAAFLAGVPVVDLWGGAQWRDNSLVQLASATKGIAAACVALLVQRGALNLEAPVALYWPEFAAGGKGTVTVRLLLSHQAGLTTVRGGATLAEVLAHDPLAAKLAAEKPHWKPGLRQIYHSRTIGHLMAELVQRVTGLHLRDFFQHNIAKPLALESDLYLGLPIGAQARLISIVGELGPSASAPDIPSDYEGLPTSDAVVRAGEPNYGGVGNARGLARLYASCVSEVDSTRLLSDEVVALVTEPQVPEEPPPRDALRFGIGFHTPVNGLLEMVGPGSFGHGGAFGSVAFGHLERRVSFAFTTNRVPAAGSGVDLAADELAEVFLKCVTATSRPGVR